MRGHRAERAVDGIARGPGPAAHDLAARPGHERGVELLEGLVRDRPDVPENHLRLAEAYVALGDLPHARPEICHSLARREALRRDDQQLLAKLVSEVEASGGPLACEVPPPAAS